MEQELEDRLRRVSKNHLLLLIQELTQRYPLLHTEIAMLLDKDTSQPLYMEERAEDDTEQETIDEDWDFGSDELAALHPISPPVLVSLDREACRQRIVG